MLDVVEGSMAISAQPIGISRRPCAATWRDCRLADRKAMLAQVVGSTGGDDDRCHSPEDGARQTASCSFRSSCGSTTRSRKHLFGIPIRHGLQSGPVDGIIRATNALLAGSTFVVAGYGWCGRGLASRAGQAGANVVRTKSIPLKALEASDGWIPRCPRWSEAAPGGHLLYAHRQHAIRSARSTSGQ